jgi:hypothetical protein
MAAHDNRAAGHGEPATARATRLATRLAGIMGLAGSLAAIAAVGGAARITTETASTSRAAAHTDCPWDTTFI